MRVFANPAARRLVSAPAGADISPVLGELSAPERWDALLAAGSLTINVALGDADARRDVEVAVTARIAPGLHLAVLRDVTATREAERRAAIERRKLEATLAALPVGVWISDPHGKLLHKNPAADLLWGGAAPLSGGVSEYEAYVAYWPDTGAVVAPEEWALWRTLARGVTVSAEPMEILRFDGQRLPVLNHSAPIFDDDGCIVGGVVVMVDASERTRAARERDQLNATLSFERQRLGSLFQMAPAMILVTRGPDHVVELANHAAVSIAQRGPLVGERIREAFAGAADSTLERRLDRVLATGRPEALKGVTLDNGTDVHYVNVLYQPLVEVDGTRSGVFVHGTDVTEETVLRRQSDALFQAIPGPTYAWSHTVANGQDDYTLALYNEAARQFSGEIVSTLLEASAREVFASRPDIFACIHRCWETHETKTLETRVTLKRGVERNLRLTFSFVPYDSVICHCEDLTTSVQLEQQLRQAQKMEAVGRLAGGVAHDFNNVLSVILSYTEMLKDDMPASDPRREDLEQVHKAGERAVSVTRQLLAFSRKQLLQPRRMDLTETVAQLAAMLRRLIGEDIELVLSASTLPTPIDADPGQIEQVVMNLVVNARDAMPGGGKLIIETANVELDDDFTASHLGVKVGRYAMLAVTDTGIGMDAQTRAQIFEPFFTTKPAGRGTGLGLAMVFGIVHQSGGTIWVYSEPGLGTTFKIYLPSARTAAETMRVPLPRTGLRGGSETILLVEDDETVRRLCRKVLERAGYFVIAASNGAEALMRVRRSKTIHLVLTDVIMPGMSGRHLVEAVARSNPDLKVIYMSGYTDDAIVHHGVVESGVPFIQKPFTASALLQQVRAVLDA